MKCTYFLHSDCLSCALLNKSYEETLFLKEQSVMRLFKGHESALLPTFGLNQSKVQGSRCKAKFAVFLKDGQLTFGLYDSFGNPSELENCPLHSEGINALLPLLKEILIRFKIPAYQLSDKTGELKYLIILKTNGGTENEHGELLLRFVLRSKESLDRLKKAVPEILQLSPLIKVVTANIQPIHQAIIEGGEEIILSENKSVIHHFDEFKLSLGARSFFQVTPDVALALYNAVSLSISENKINSMIDLYCGVGTFSFFASRTCRDIIGIEISKEAIAYALNSNILNGTDIVFKALDVKEFLEKNTTKFEAILVNPPRRGLNSSILKMIKEINPRVLYYSSCNAETMARDYSELFLNYQIKSLQIFDMFPYTLHYETLMCLERK